MIRGLRADVPVVMTLHLSWHLLTSVGKALEMYRLFHRPRWPPCVVAGLARQIAAQTMRHLEDLPETTHRPKGP